jgi:hypothetical protein
MYLYLLLTIFRPLLRTAEARGFQHGRIPSSRILSCPLSPDLPVCWVPSDDSEMNRILSSQDIRKNQTLGRANMANRHPWCSPPPLSGRHVLPPENKASKPTLATAHTKKHRKLWLPLESSRRSSRSVSCTSFLSGRGGRLSRRAGASSWSRRRRTCRPGRPSGRQPWAGPARQARTWSGRGGQSWRPSWPGQTCAWCRRREGP